ncbi:MAG: SH3 domain-containing protein [Gallionella sp.]
MTLRFNQFFLSAILLLPSIAQAVENGTTIKSDSIKAAPFSDAKVIATLPAGARVDILKKDGGWYQIKSPQGSGWIRMLSLRRGEVKAGSAGSELSGLASLASGRSGTGKVVSTTGIRGLNEEELKAAKYDEKQITLAESYATSRSEAQKFAAGARLAAHQMNYLPEPGGSSK